MIDLIFIAAFAAVFYGGFKAGQRFKSIAEMVEAAVGKFKSSSK